MGKKNFKNFEYIEYPVCHSDKLIRYGTYERNIGIQGDINNPFVIVEQ